MFFITPISMKFTLLLTYLCWDYNTHLIQKILHSLIIHDKSNHFKITFDHIFKENLIENFPYKINFLKILFLNLRVEDLN